MNRLSLYIIALLSLVGVHVNAQETNVRQEVRVIKPYEPVINDAFKISELPKIVDTTKVSPEFEYEILPVKHETGFKPQPIKPARLINEPLSKLYYGHLKGGFGSHLSPLAQIHIGSKRSEDWNWKLIIDHLSSNGKIKNEADERVYAGFSNTNASGSVSRFTDNNQVISLGANYFNKSNYYYGYNIDSVNEETYPAPLKKADIEKQNINFFKANANWRTNYLDSAHVNYKVDLSWETTQGKASLNENAFKIKSNIDYYRDNNFIGVDFALNYYTNNQIDDTLNGAIVKFSPWVGAFGKKWRIVAGVHTFYDQNNEKYHFYPSVSMHYNIIDYFLIPYFEYDGSFEENSYVEIYNRNPFIRQNLGVKPTDTKMNVTFGFRGNISSKIAFNAKVNYADINDQYFFVNDTSLQLNEKFEVSYDDLTRVRILGELSYKMNKKLRFSFKTNIFKYTLENEAQAWHLPNYNMSFNTRYNMQNKIIVNANIFGVGTRYAKTYDADLNVVEKELPGVIDLNLGLEYRLLKMLSVFADFNNIGAVRYYEWNQYPAQRFNFMVGATYVF
ncbi:MAG: TonB-dependent receptor [Salinivirgaceae bacterium]|nr:TonB-dependent receptor [Salinivirgaceae bacterium]